MTTVHIMHDLETWGTDPGHDLRSIGACVFNPVTGYVALLEERGTSFDPNHVFYQAVHNPEREGFEGFYDGAREKNVKFNLMRDPQTVQWWSEQSAEAQGAFTNSIDIDIGLMHFATWLNSFGPDIRLWSHGENMDEPMLRIAYKACGLKCIVGGREQNAPWHYRAPRDTRTIFEAAGMDPAKCVEPYTVSNGGIYHHALHDAIAQAHAVCEAYQKLGLRGEAIDDVKSHAGDWRTALTNMRDTSDPAMGTDDKTYWQHQLNVLERILKGLA